MDCESTAKAYVQGRGRLRVEQCTNRPAPPIAPRRVSSVAIRYECGAMAHEGSRGD